MQTVCVLSKEESLESGRLVYDVVGVFTTFQAAKDSLPPTVEWVGWYGGICWGTDTDNDYSTYRIVEMPINH